MSPASQGALEVERYIGSCLISSNARPGAHKSIVGKKQEPVVRGKTRGCYGGQNYGAVTGGAEQCQVQYGPSGWAGAPLISMTSSPRRCNQRSSPLLGQHQHQQQQQQQQPSPQSQQQTQHQACEQQVPVHLHKSPLSRLAIHTQGAPLILAGRFHNRSKLHNSGNAGGVTSTACNTAANSYAAAHSNGTATPTTTTTMMSGQASGAIRCPPTRSQRPTEPAKKQQVTPKSDCPASKETAGTNIANIDSLSIASDESSGSNNSENSLPRIIKPRKRRKKDRKPPNNIAATIEVAKQEEQQLHFNSPATMEQQSSIVTLKPYVPSCYEQRYECAPTHFRNHRRPPIARESVYSCRTPTLGPSMQEIADVRQRYAHRHVEVKVLDDNRNVVLAPARVLPPKAYRHNSHHVSNSNNNNNNNNSNNNNNVPRYFHDYNGPTVCEDGVRDGLGSCQCRYCDPSALIWDVDQNCYSPFLTPSPSSEFCPSHYPQIPLYLSRPGGPGQEQAVERLFGIDKSPRHLHEKNVGSGVVLRRSWSDPTSYFSEEISAPNKDVGVIGDRGQPEGGKRRTLWRGDTIGIPAGNIGSTDTTINGSQPASKGLEVSTEIITSPNGHRDLEIKFYSPSPIAATSEEDKAIFLTEEVDEDEEDFSDIWSYHESKLQQDFRTLLQAEE